MRPPPFILAVFCMLCLQSIVEPAIQLNKSVNNKPKIQVAILLDVSNSMDGLIEQAKNQLWNMVNVLSKVTCNGEMPQIEIALYEYGRPENNPKDGYVKQISSFTNNLDSLYRKLISLTTYGGDEYCGHVIYNSLEQLAWDTLFASYKVIFIAGNESFLQGDISYTKACEKAKEKNVVINTIYCGDRNKGISENWNLGAECGNGSFTNIDQNAKEEIFSTPYDSTLIILNKNLTNTYIYYGVAGKESFQSMSQWDTIPEYNVRDINKIIGYVVVKSNKKIYNKSTWDLVDAYEKDNSIIEKVDIKTLPDSLKNKTRKEIKQIVETEASNRSRIQKQIADLTKQRDNYIVAEKAKLKINDPQTLQTEIEKIIRNQIAGLNMKIN